MLNYSYEEINYQIRRIEEERSYYVFKNFISDEYIPEWKDILKQIYNAAGNLENEWISSQIKNDKEKLFGNLIITDGIYMNYLGNDETFINEFPKVGNIFNNLNKNFQDNGSVGAIRYYGPKISLGPYKVPSHRDRWNPGLLQCEGSASWIIKNEDNQSFEIQTHRGDFIYMHKSFYHEVEINEPRAALLFTSRGVFIQDQP